MEIRKKIFIVLLVGSFCLSSCGALIGGAIGGVVGGVTPIVTANATVKKEKKKEVSKKPEPLLPQLTEEQQRKYDYFYLEAIRLKVQKNYGAAFDMLQHCLSINPNASSALYEVAQYYMFLKKLPQGQAALEKAVKNDPDNYWYSQGLAGFYMQQDEVEKAATLLEGMATRFSAKLDPLYSLLDIYNRQEKYDKVIATLNRLEARTGKSEQLSMEKFRIYLQKKDSKSAFREIEALVEEYPMDMRYRVVLGDVYMQNGKKKEAYDIYRQVLEEEPENAQAMYSLASYYEETGQKELYERQLDTLMLNKKVPSDTKLNVMRQFIMQNEQEGKDSTRVITLFGRIMEQDPDDAQLPMLYVQYLLAKNMNKEALPVLRQVLDIDPANTAARMMLIGDAAQKEDAPEIIRLCEAGIETSPDKLEFYYYLAMGYAQTERTDDVIAVCRKALGHVNADSKKEVVSDFYAFIGDSYHTKKQNKEAYAAYDSALVYNPSNIGALNNYAYYLSVERRDLDRAEEMSYKTVKAEPGNSTYLDTYAWILFEKENYAEARLYIDDAMKSDGAKSDVIVEHCGDIYYMTGDVDGALKYWKQALEMGSKSNTLKQKIAKKKYIADETKNNDK
ncbi:tetratricopeptide repeat protein [Bacteroides helcogenes]|uniref:Tetratricopeptide TPR_1 repeat-containing protein n=1 Tax=Bacteroides helcogenes (strain ATCC 35417 / DSM 20613 / JCM 6297 / CCUG 15421 / P 36-108) TaxID=693979 RepID=E6SVH7_BACT6|nr:tetratricopeptide repeat protein [Bacteroides helcogenes]ADV42487.1 Tetratricopeptide TPR_1 repeat-containing protein [Bacteroides helcogenes P 36-108]MDY5237752.1 tetratricopeptide repeat protein [Bacteroides helcogenes]